MNFNDVIKSISEVMPPFNNFILTQFVKNTIDNSPAFPAFVFKEGFKIVPADIKFAGYKTLSPEERVKFELRANSGKSTRPKVPLTVSHLSLVEYHITFEGQSVTSRLYMPYMVNNMLFIKDKRSIVRKVILEKTFSRVSERDKDGISVSPVRVNLPFNRKYTFKAESYITREHYIKFIITGKLFHGGRPKKKICDTTIVHYLLGKFGFIKTLRRFGLSKSDVFFVEEVLNDTDKYEYFVAKAYDPKTGEAPKLFLKVKKTILNDDQSLKFVVNLLYVLKHCDMQSIDNVYVEGGGSIWTTMIGLILFEDKAKDKAFSNGQTHYKSVDTFIDPLTRDRFKRFGIEIEDIYDLLVYIFINIDGFMVNNLAQDLYNSRIDVSNGILVGSYATKINWNIYYLAKKTNISLSDVKTALRFSPMLFKMSSATGQKDDSEHYIAPPEIVGDNLLFAGGLSKIRLGGKAEQRLHPSMLVAESINAFVGKYMGKTGLLNPYIPTDENGSILHPDYTSEIDGISAYLPR